MRRLSPPGAAFLDRDGTINEKAPEGEYITRIAELRVLPGAAAAIRRLNDAGVPVIVVTNQRGIAVGRMSAEDLDDIHGELSRQLSAQAGSHIDAVFYCPHDEGECGCRKPGTGMIRQALRRFPSIDVGRSVMVGDAVTDVEAGRRAGTRTIQLGVEVVDLTAAVERLLGPAQERRDQ